MSGRALMIIAVVTAGAASGCTGEITRTAAEIYGEEGPTSFNQLAQRQSNIIPPGQPAGPDQSGQPAGPDQSGQPAGPDQPAPPAAAGSGVQPELLRIVTESRCHPGDLDNGMPDFWGTMGNGSAVDGFAYTFTVEAEDGSLLATVNLGPEKLISAAQQKAVHVEHELIAPLTITLPPHLAGKGFFANLFACVDADQDGSCADEELKPSDASPWPDMGGMPGFGNKAFESRLVASQALEATIEGGKLVFKPVEADEGDKSPWSDASGFTAGLLKNIPADDEGFALRLAVRSGATQCSFSPRDMGCFVAGTTIRVGPRSVAVEHLGRGAKLATADGRIVTSLRSVTGPEAEPVVTFRTARGHALTVTSLHPVLTRAGLKTAAAVTLDDLLIAEGNVPVRVTSITRAPYQGQVYNFALPGARQRDHLVVAEGLVVGDLVLQEQLARTPAAK